MGNDTNYYQADPPPLEERPESEGDLAHQGEDPRKVNYVPNGYESVEEFLKEAREEFQLDLDADKDNRENGIEDAEFVAIDPWDPKDRKLREEAGRPCIVVNTLPQFIGQVVGDRRMNRASIRAVPQESGDKDLAEIRSGIIRSIEAKCKAERVYDAALEDQVTSSIGNFRIVMDWADNSVFDQDIFIRQIGNPWAVVWDRMALDPTGRDAERCFVQDIIPRKAYEERWGEIDGDISGLTSDESSFYKAGWVDESSVRVTEYWQMKSRTVTLVMLNDGSVKEFKPPMDASQIMVNPRTGKPMMRETRQRYACMHLITGFRILEGPYELPIDRVPIIRVNGREIRVGEKRVRFGLVRWARDPARMRNYWRSVAVEQLAMAPKNQYLAQHKSVKGREEDFREAHLTNDPLLVYNDNTDEPKRQDPPSLNAAVLQEIQMNTQDIKDTTGLQDASLGIRSNEVSGKAIMARQREGDVATIIYHDNLNAAIEEGGRVINQLIPVCYDTMRTVRLLGIDGRVHMQKLNDPQDPSSVDISKGSFDIEVTTGPSYTTQRMFGAEAMIEALKTMPEQLSTALDIIVEEQDWPGAQKLAERIKRQLPPELIRDPNEPPTPEEIQAKQQEAEAEQLKITAMVEEQEYVAEERRLGLAEKEQKVLLLEEQARKVKAEADEAEARADREELELQVASRTAAHRTAREIDDLTNPPQPSRGNGEGSRGAKANSGSQSSRQSRRPKPRNNQ